MKVELKPTEADALIDQCLTEDRCFHVIAGAGSGKTASLIRALESIRDQKGALLRRTGQKVVCLTFTKRAVEVIRKRLRWDELFIVSTLHGFLWGEIGRFSKDIQKALYDDVVPSHIAHARKDDDGKATKKATTAREKAEKLEAQREALLKVASFRYADGPYSDYAEGELGHDDVISVAASLRGCLKKRWVIPTGYDSSGFARFDGVQNGLERNHPSALCPANGTLCKRHDRSGMGTG